MFSTRTAAVFPFSSIMTLPLAMINSSVQICRRAVARLHRMETIVRLGKRHLQERSRSPEIDLPPARTLELPERVLQFGAGVFLRAFLDEFIQRANNRADFNGRVVVVQRAPDARSRAACEQDGLYTLWLRGLERGRQV